MGKKRIAVLGGTGYVGRLLARHLVGHERYELGPIVGSDASAGKKYSTVWIEKEARLVENYGDLWSPQSFPPEYTHRVVETIEAVTHMTCDFVISCLAPTVEGAEEQIIDKKIPLFSMCPRNRKGNLYVAEVNMEQMIQRIHAGSLLFKTPNCVVCGLSILLKAISQMQEVREACVTTIQSISGRGDALYSTERIVHNVMPLGNSGEDTQFCIQRELTDLCNIPAVSVRAYRVGVHAGHTIDLRLRLANRVSEQEVLLHLRNFSVVIPFGCCARPHACISVQLFDGSPHPRQTSIDHKFAKGMQVLVGNVEVDSDGWDLCMTLVLNNLILGAYGSVLQLVDIFERVVTQQEVSA